MATPLKSGALRPTSLALLAKALAAEPPVVQRDTVATAAAAAGAARSAEALLRRVDLHRARRSPGPPSLLTDTEVTHGDRLASALALPPTDDELLSPKLFKQPLLAAPHWWRRGLRWLWSRDEPTMVELSSKLSSKLQSPPPASQTMLSSMRLTSRRESAAAEGDGRGTDGLGRKAPESPSSRV